MRGLLINDDAKQRVKRVLDHALEPSHWYRPRRNGRIPGDDPNFVTHLDYGYRCVFSITEDASGQPWRHLSISVDGKNYPSPFAAYTIAEMFGFTGWDGKSQKPPEGWALRIDEVEHCIALGQPYQVKP